MSNFLMTIGVIFLIIGLIYPGILRWHKKPTRGKVLLYSFVLIFVAIMLGQKNGYEAITIKNKTILEKAKPYEIVKVEDISFAGRDKVIQSADMSAKHFLVSQEIVFENQKHYRKNERRLKIRQRCLSRRQKDSNNRGKERLRIAKFYQQIVNERKGYQLNLAHKLSKQFDALIFEDLNMKGMQQFNSGLSKTIMLDFSFSEFLFNVEWKCFKENKHFIKIDRWFPSSKLCSNCGQIKEDLQLSDRQYICSCGLNIDRDLNAAIVNA